MRPRNVYHNTLTFGPCVPVRMRRLLLLVLLVALFVKGLSQLSDLQQHGSKGQLHQGWGIQRPAQPAPAAQSDRRPRAAHRRDVTSSSTVKSAAAALPGSVQWQQEQQQGTSGPSPATPGPGPGSQPWDAPCSVSTHCYDVSTKPSKHAPRASLCSHSSGSRGPQQQQGAVMQRPHPWTENRSLRQLLQQQQQQPEGVSTLPTSGNGSSNQVSIKSQLLLSFVRMDYKALIARPPAMVESFQRDLMASLCGILDTWVKDTGSIWRPNNNNSSSSGSSSGTPADGEGVGTQPAGLWQQLPADYVQYSCTVNSLKAGSVLVNMTIASTAGLTGAAASASNSTDAVQTLGLLLKRRVSLLGSMLGAGAALSPGFHTSYDTKQDVVVVRMQHEWVDSTQAGTGVAVEGSSSSGQTSRGLMWRTGLYPGVIAAGVVGIVAGVALILYLRHERRAEFQAVVVTPGTSKPCSRHGSQLSHRSAAAAAIQSADQPVSRGSQAASDESSEEDMPPEVIADLRNSLSPAVSVRSSFDLTTRRSHESTIRRSHDLPRTAAAAGAAAGAVGASAVPNSSRGGRPQRANLSVHVTTPSEFQQDHHPLASPDASPGDVMLVPVAGRSWRMVRNLHAAAYSISTAQAQAGGVRHTPAAMPGVTWSPRAAWAATGESGGDPASSLTSSPRLAAAIIPDAALLEAMQQNPLHGRRLLMDLDLDSDAGQ